jgi:hypothetical protein
MTRIHLDCVFCFIISLQKGWVLCQEVTGQGPLVKAPAQAGVWARDKAEAEWADRMPRGRAEIVCVRIAARRFLILPDNHVIK